MVLLSALFYTLSAGAQQSAPPAAEVLKPVLAAAGEQNKNVLIIFHASWCVWCRKMDASLAHAEVAPLVNRYFLIEHLTVDESPDKKHLENAGAKELMEKNGGANAGLPYWLVMNAEGEIVADANYRQGKNSGCPATEEEVAHFIEVLKKTTSLHAAELEIIRKRFRENEN